MPNPPPLYSVASLTESIGAALRQSFSRIRVEGEIGSITFHTSGHWYLTLKDSQATLSATMWRNANSRLGWRPMVGEKVVAEGTVEVYAPRGTYSLIIQQLQRAGAGDLQARFEATKARLQAEGLFAMERKRPIPSFPAAVGIVTSTDGAALRDILKVHSERMPCLPIVVAGCKVQGAGAAIEIAAALDLLNRHGQVQVIILARGGGSMEDLWAFQEEPVVRAVVRSRVPVVSGVGHEVDVSLADLAADLRAATPTHAAQRVFPDRVELGQRVREVERRLIESQKSLLKGARSRLDSMRSRLRDPRRSIFEGRVRCDELADRLDLCFRRILLSQRKKLDLLETLEKAIRRLLITRRQRLDRQEGQLKALSPYGTLDRGYAIVRHDAHVVTDASTLERGDRVEILLSRGEIQARVEETRVRSP